MISNKWESYADQGRGIAMGLAPAFFEPAPLEDPAIRSPRSTFLLGKSFMAIRQRGPVTLG